MKYIFSPFQFSMLKQAGAAFLLLFQILLMASCGTKEPGSRRTGASTLSFDSLAGVRYIEVRREFDNGIAFNDMGFRQVPEWDMYFIHGDSTRIYNPFEKRYINFPIYFDHDSVFNTARQWFRLKKVSKDSLWLQLLQVEQKKVLKERSNVYMKFYSEEYLKSTGRSVEEARAAKPQDSLYIKKLAARANRNSASIDSAFAASNPVMFQSANPNLSVEREMPKRTFLDFKASDVYMQPVYNITIHKAYKDFVYEFAVLVDEKGIIRFGELLTVVEDIENRKAVLNAIIKLYLQPMLKVASGSTLGVKHSSLITLKVKGLKAAD